MPNFFVSKKESFVNKNLLMQFKSDIGKKMWGQIFILDFVRNIGAIHRGVGQSSGIPYRVKREDFIFSSISYHQNETISFL
jgi:hypothetical protein